MSNAVHTRRGGHTAWVAVVAAGSLVWACGGPTTPDTRTGVLGLRIICEGLGANPLVCRAETYCVGPYRCPEPGADGRDVTASAQWTCDDGSVARVAGPGRIEAVGLGDAVIRARLTNYVSEAFQPMSVFAGPLPLPTHEISGTVWESGKTAAVGYISGAVIEVLDGAVAGRRATSGTPPPLLPGYFGLSSPPGLYRVLGVPPGRYSLRATADGYVSQTRIGEVSARGGPVVDFELVRQ